MHFLHKPLTWKFCLGATVLFVVLDAGTYLYSKEFPGVTVRNAAVGFLILLFAAYAIVFLGATLSFLVADASGASTLPPPPLWTRFVGIFYFVFLVGPGLFFGPGTNSGRWLFSPLGTLFREVDATLLAAGIPLVAFACATSGRPSATLWDKICFWINAVWLAGIFFIAYAFLE